MEAVKKLGVILTLAALGLAVAPPVTADPAATTATPTTTATPAPTPEEQALRAHFDPIQTQMAAAVTARRYDDYAAALNQLTTPDCQFFSLNGQSASKTKFLEAERQALASQPPGLTETMRTLTLTVTGQTALETALVTDDKDAVDTAGQYGARGRTHHWQRQTSLRLHWASDSTANAARPRASRKQAPAVDPGSWHVQQIAITGVDLYLDGQPYIPPRPKTTTPRRTTQPTKPRTQKRTSKAKARRSPYVIPGVRVY